MYSAWTVGWTERSNGGDDVDRRGVYFKDVMHSAEKHLDFLSMTPRSV